MRENTAKGLKSTLSGQMAFMFAESLKQSGKDTEGLRFKPSMKVATTALRLIYYI